MEPQLDLPSPEEELHGEHGEVFTRRWAAELILDLAGYTSDRDLGALTAVEPACGSGAFVVPMIERLLESAQMHDRSPEDLVGAIQGFDLLSANVVRTRHAAGAALVAGGLAPTVAYELAATWLVQRDFLLTPPPERSVDIVVGNPPYIRLEAVPRARSEVYRSACLTMGGRADVYIGFYERALLALRPGGSLAFICADRWMRNAYGARLRAMISDGWSLDSVISMTGVDAFEEAVDAYPAITVLSRRPQVDGPLIVEAAPTFDATAADLIPAMAARREPRPVKTEAFSAARLNHWFAGSAGWPTGTPERLAVIAELEANFPPLESMETRTRVGIGVATGADKVFIVSDVKSIEQERLMPLAMARDIASGRVVWSGKHLVNPWDGDTLIDLADWPKTAGYLSRFREHLAGRHTARRGSWYRTIDRVVDGLKDSPKLYLPDFKEVMFPVLDEGHTYPHHNLYWVTSERWDLRVLGGLLMSEVANLFIEAYSVRMRGGFLRFQAQYLRRIRLPRPEDIGRDEAEGLADAFDRRDRLAATALALPLYGLRELPAS